jgi:iron complex transport system ATP-binding protein
MNHIEIRSLSVEFDGCHLIKDISANFELGEITSIIGSNGSGKSSLLKAVVGIFPFQAKSLTVNGESLIEKKPQHRASLVAYMPQQLEIEENLIVEDFFHYSRFPQMESFRKLAPAEVKLRDRICVELKIAHLLKRKVSQVSGGELKKISIGGTFFQGCRYVLLDEPFQALDPVVKSEVAEFLRTAVDQFDCGIIMACHDLYWVQTLSDKALLLKRGELAHFGELRGVFTNENLTELYGQNFMTYTSEGSRDSILLPSGCK